MRWALIRSSRRLVSVIVEGSIFWVVSNRSIHGPYRRHDDRFRLLPTGWRP